jgi:hypothetical protein
MCHSREWGREMDMGGEDDPIGCVRWNACMHVGERDNKTVRVMI